MIMARNFRLGSSCKAFFLVKLKKIFSSKKLKQNIIIKSPICNLGTDMFSSQTEPKTTARHLESFDKLTGGFISETDQRRSLKLQEKLPRKSSWNLAN